MRHLLPGFLWLSVLIAFSTNASAQKSLKNFSGIVALYDFKQGLNNTIRKNGHSAKLTKSTRLKNQMLYVNGKYDGYDTHFYLDEALSVNKSFTFSYSFKPDEFNPKSYARNLICFGYLNRWLNLKRYKAGHLALALNNGRFSYQFKNTKIEANKWYNVTFTYEASRNHIEVYLNGKRLYEVDLGKFKIKGGSDFSFCDYGGGNVFKGYAQKLVFLNRFMPRTEFPAFYKAVIRDIPEVMPHAVTGTSHHTKGQFSYDIEKEWSYLPSCVEGDKGKRVEVVCPNRRQQTFHINYKEKERQYVILRNGFSSIGGYKFRKFDACLDKLLDIAKTGCK
ncbi:hypothetical protein BKI52_16630 [marine bacterium AO1-C]|nr:hypothetical protein BKI52_16630 [marine bacterium AO1-C]